MKAATISHVGETYTGMPKGLPIRSPGDWLAGVLMFRRLLSSISMLRAAEVRSAYEFARDPRTRTVPRVAFRPSAALPRACFRVPYSGLRSSSPWLSAPWPTVRA
ncbi:hypothetical protein Pmi06nite_56240 [Planotetraspora mira]|uniref:Uncharacterized protein n=1 Tax=Planotetraspora mira TaxID=58121 RepID=A0A8J3X8H7_9ACTN|nr:hypothetical protein Pmi06nite_56240 [Planotetraspora mira]